MSGEKYIGHQGTFIRFESPDFGVVTYVGELQPEEMETALEELRVFCQGKKYVLTMVDVRRAATIPASARRRAGEVGKGLPVRGTAIIVASFHMRMLTTLIVKTFQIFDRVSDRDAPTRFFSSEEDAREWIAGRRAELVRELR